MTADQIREISNRQSAICNLQYDTPMPVKPPTVVTAEWTGDLVFTVRAGDHAIVADGDSARGLSPVQLLGAAMAGCMAADIALILTRGRQPLKSLTVSLSARRADDDPHRVLGVQMHFAVGGDVNPSQLDRAIQLSRDKYCSVWHSMREDITLETTTSVDPAG
jgi:putative redox protein